MYEVDPTYQPGMAALMIPVASRVLRFPLRHEGEARTGSSLDVPISQWWLNPPTGRSAQDTPLSALGDSESVLTAEDPCWSRDDGW